MKTKSQQSTSNIHVIVLLFQFHKIKVWIYISHSDFTRCDTSELKEQRNDEKMALESIYGPGNKIY